MRRYWKRWLGLVVFVALLGTTFVLLGRWQLNRLAERKQTNAQIVAHQHAEPLPFPSAFHGTITDADQWVRVTVTGTYDDAHTLRVRYRTNNGKKSGEFVTPLRADDGRVVLVDRGYALSERGQEPTPPPAPTGRVSVTGYVRRDEQGPQNARTPQDAQIRLIDAPSIASTLPYPVVDGYLAVAQSEPTEPTLRPLPLPTLDEGPHLSYAIQWFCFTALAVGGVFVFIRGDIRDNRKRKAREARAAAAASATATTEGQPAEENHEPE